MTRKRRPDERPKLMTNLLPRLCFLEQKTDIPMMYEHNQDTIYLNRRAGQRIYCLAHALCKSTGHKSRLNTIEMGPQPVDEKYILDNVEMNIATFLLAFFLGKMSGDDRKYIMKVIEGWSMSYTKRVGKPPRVDWTYINQMATFFVPKDKEGNFYKRTKLIKKIVTKRFLTCSNCGFLAPVCTCESRIKGSAM